MTRPFYVSSQMALCGLVALTLVGTAGVARCDIKIVAEVQVTPSSSSSGSTPPPPVTVTTYYKGKMSRSETADGTVTIYDGAANKVYTLDPKQKTYYVQDAKKALESSESAVTLPQGSHLDTNLSLTKGDETKSIIGKDTQKYALTGLVKVVRDSSGFGGGGFGGGRRGGFGGGGGGGRHGGGGRMPSTQIAGELWLTNAVTLPKEDKYATLLLLRSSIHGAPFLKSLSDQVSKLKQFPLYAKISITRSTRNDSFSDTPPEPTVITSEVKSISTDSLDDTLFKAPSDYQKVDPPIASAGENAIKTRAS